MNTPALKNLEPILMDRFDSNIQPQPQFFSSHDPNMIISDNCKVVIMPGQAIVVCEFKENMSGKDLKFEIPADSILKVEIESRFVHGLKNVLTLCISHKDPEEVVEYFVTNLHSKTHYSIRKLAKYIKDHLGIQVKDCTEE